MRKKTYIYSIYIALSWFLSGTLYAQETVEWDFSTLTQDEDSITPLPVTLEGWRDRLRNFGRQIPQEEVFVHMDNTCYFQGDTLYYKAYVRRSDTGKLTNLSRLLYAELWNHDGYLVERQWVELRDGQGHGTFLLPDTLYSGFYELRAYTRWQLNWGEFQHPHWPYDERMFLTKKMAKEFYRDYEKLYSRVFPLYDKPSSPGDYARTMEHMRVMQRRFKRAEPASPMRTYFYPEGGALTADADVRVAFEARREDGEHLQGNIVLYDAHDNPIAEAPAENRGRGVLAFHCKSGEKYHTVFTTEDGATVEADLPAADRDGCAICLDSRSDSISIAIQPRGSAGEETLGITITSNGQYKYFRKLPPQQHSQIDIPSAMLPTGVSQVTVFNSQGRVYADRLFFVRHADLQESCLAVDVPDTVFQPLQSITVSLNNPEVAQSTVSLAIRDKSNATPTYDNGNILTEMLLCSQIRGFVESPGYYFESNDALHQRHLDLLMMVQGWRRHNWLQMTTPGLFRINHPYEKSPILYGSVNRYQTLGRDGFYGWEGDDYVWQQPDYFEYRRTRSNSITEGSIPVLGLASEERELFLKYCHLSRKDDPDNPANWNYNGPGYIKKDVLVHAEFTYDELGYNVFAEEMSKNGRFMFQLPRCYWPYKMFLGASDSSKWGKKSLVEASILKRLTKKLQKELKSDPYLPEHQWIQLSGSYPEYYVRLVPYHPRFVMPYNFYQRMGVPMRKSEYPGLKSGLTQLDFSQPAIVVDAYRAFNDASDAGFIPAWYTGIYSAGTWLDRLYTGGMNMLPLRFHPDNPLYGRLPALPIRGEDYHLQPNPSHVPFARSKDPFALIYNANRWDLVGHGAGRYYDPRHGNYAPTSDYRKGIHFLSNTRNFRIYTDYSPRMEGWRRYQGENQPQCTISGDMLDDTVRPTYRDRYYIMPGFAASYIFYQPDYSNCSLPDVQDYRRTLYWNPDLQLDEEGKAQVTFYNNSRNTTLDIEVEGISNQGKLITNSH